MTAVCADLGLERNPDSMRGFVVQAWLVGLLALMAAAALLRWSTGPRMATDPDEGVDQRGAPFIKHTSSTLARLCLGAGVVIGVLKAVVMLATPAPQAVVITRLGNPSALALGDGGLLHVGSNAGCFDIDLQSKELRQTGGERGALHGVKALLKDGDTLWVAGESGLHARRRTGIQAAKAGTGGDVPAVFSLLKTRDGHILAGGSGVIWRLTASGTWDRAELSALPRVAVLFEDKSGHIWAGCDDMHGGLMRGGEDGALIFEDATAGLPHRSVCDLGEDKDGVLWVACGFAAFGGTASWDDATKSWRALDGPPGLEGGKIRSLLLDSQGAFWFCSEYDGVTILKNDAWHRRPYPRGFPCREVKDALELDGGFWLATERGVIWLEKHPLAASDDRKGALRSP